MNKDREHITELFKNDGIKAPDSLSEENMLAMLEKADAGDAGKKTFEKRRPASRPRLRMLMGIAAALVVAVFGISGLADVLSSPPDTSSAEGELYTFSSESEIEKILQSIVKPDNGGLIPKGSELVEYEALPSVSQSDAAASGDAGTGSHSETYLQVENVDEADIVKTDGKYIYYVTSDMEVVILSADGGKTEKVSTVGHDGVDNYVSDIYLKGDRLITVGTYYREDSDTSCSGIVVYDISDRSRPKELFDFSQSGTILSSRMVGDYVYLVTNDYVYRGGRSVPLCGSADALSPLDAKDICCVPDPRRASFLVLSAVDISSGEHGRSKTKAILGPGEDIYCNDRNLYSVSSEWNDDEDGSTCTRIVRASFDGLKVKFDATAKVRGYVDSQFSMDEKDGYFRIATTSERGGINVNNLYVLDPDLKETGSVTGFARNESIKAVRYIEDKAYVITYEAIDPLFIIDLSDPEEPVIEGEVMIDGFSTLLIPLSENRLLGIGHATGDNGYGGEYDSGLKLALFDISDPSHPAVLDSKEFDSMTSPAQSDHHALMVAPDDGYYAIPYSIDYFGDIFIDGGGVIVDEDSTADSGEDVSGQAEEPEIQASHEDGVLVFRAADEIDVTDKHVLDDIWIRRNVCIDGWIYAIDGDGGVQSFRPEL